jgi:hypothetical protein
MSNDLTILGAEIAAIESEMGNRQSDYWRSPVKQERIRTLYALRAGSVAEGYSDPTILLPIDSEAEFHAYAPDGDYGAYLNFMRVAADVVLAVPDGEQAAFIASVEALPAYVAAAAIDELLDLKPAVEWSSEQAIGAFSEMPEGAVLVREWGHDARRNLSIVRERLFRVIDRLESDSDIHRFAGWLDGLTTGSAVALYRKLAA